MAGEFTYDPYKFTTKEFAVKGKQCFDDYIELRIQGVERRASIIKAFDLIAVRASLDNAYELALALECNSYYKANFDVQLKAKKASELWNTNKSINRMLQIVEDPREKGQTKVAAMKELNVLVGITVVDEKGNTRKGGSLEDFYASMDGQTPATAAPKSEDDRNGPLH